MNSRIKELISQAQKEVWDNNPYNSSPELDPEKFAELIIQECCDRLVQDDFGSVKGVMRIAGAKLKEHFGVK